MLLWIIVLIIIILIWLEIIPVRLWLAQSKIKYYRKKTRAKIRIIKILQPILNWWDEI